MLPLLLLAQAQPPDPISGGAGWVGAGLLGLVLAWLLLKHLPAKDSQLEKIIDKKDAQISSILDTKNSQMELLINASRSAQDRMHDEHQKAITRITEHCEAEMQVAAEAWSRELKELSLTISALKEQIKSSSRP